MLIITKREKIGAIHNKAIYRVASFQILPLASNLSNLNETQVIFILVFVVYCMVVKCGMFFFF